MTIEPCSPEVISMENFTPTEIENLFINPTTGQAVFVECETAYRIKTTE